MVRTEGGVVVRPQPEINLGYHQPEVGRPQSIDGVGQKGGGIQGMSPNLDLLIAVTLNHDTLGDAGGQLRGVLENTHDVQSHRNDVIGESGHHRQIVEAPFAGVV